MTYNTITEIQSDIEQRLKEIRKSEKTLDQKVFNSVTFIIRYRRLDLVVKPTIQEAIFNVFSQR